MVRALLAIGWLSMSTTASSQQRFQVNLAGVIEVLSRHLYRQGPEVIIRELLQNAADALTARKIMDPTHAGAIELECDSLGADSTEWLLTVSDDGIGLERSEVESCLATIGFSQKALGQDTTDVDTPFIGRFGVGLLSCFMVADEISIVSRSLHPGHEPFRWIGHANGNWEIHSVDQPVACGTKVFIKVGMRNGATLKPSGIADLAAKFGEYLPWKITVSSSDGSRLVTRVPFWEDAKTPEQLARLETEYFGSGCLGAFTFKSPGAGAEGVAFISKSSVMPGGEPTHRLYVHRMLVSTRARGLTPTFAPFLRCVVSSNLLRVNAAREDVHGEERRLTILHDDIAAALRTYLKNLARDQPGLLTQIALIHHECFLGAAEAGGEFIDILRAVFPLHTTLGEATFDRILSRHGRVEYVDDERDYFRIELKSQQEGDCVVRGDYRMANRLLSLLVRKLGAENVRRLAASEYLARFGKSQEILTAEEKRIVEFARRELERESCVVEFEDADDAAELATLNLGDEESLERLLGCHNETAGNGNGIPNTDTARKRLVLNRTHPVVELLLGGRDLPTDLVQSWLRLIFHHALLASRETPTNGENRRLSRALGTLWKATYSTNL
jgi:molecular chaperone HtpG